MRKNAKNQHAREEKFLTVPIANTGGDVTMSRGNGRRGLMEEGMGKRLSRRKFLQAAAGAPWAGAVSVESQNNGR